ncbi:MAG: hypothetical protein R3F54_16465 [Alphaproteobacteria bacterium]
MTIDAPKFFFAALAATAALALPTGPADAQMAHQFTLIGHIESFSVDDVNDPLSGGRIKVHGVEVVLPKNLIIQMPARYLTAKDIVDLNPAHDGTSGLALDDQPLAAYEATVVGNIVGDRYVAGLVWIAQHSLATGAGFIQAIGADGEIQVVADPAGGAGQPVARIRINDPAEADGIYYAPPDPNADERFIVDTGNPTVHAGTGFPMCVAQAGREAECPAGNRPRGDDGTPLTTFVMGNEGLPATPPGALPIPPCPACDPERPAPFMVGDYIVYAGTLAKDGTGDIYISAHTVEANVGIYTARGVDPAYVLIEDSLIGTQGPLVPRDPANPDGATFPQETQDRFRVEGVTTDPSRPVVVYAIDVDAATGEQTLRRLQTPPFDPPPLGRFRITLGQRANALFAEGNVTEADVRGAPRELVARIGDDDLDGQPLPKTATAANGLVAGQYVAPFGEFIFPENKVYGDPILPNNFDCLPFLLNGSGPLKTTSDDGPLVGPLDPWPDIVRPAAVNCGPRPKPII